jgi:hypothetical protein
MLTPADIRQKALRLWETQAFLKSWLAGAAFEPLEFPLGLPAGRALLHRFAEVQVAIKTLKAGSKDTLGYGYVLCEEAIANRQVGAQFLPRRARIETPGDFLKLIGKRQAFGHFERLVAETRERLPELGTFLGDRPLIALAHEAHWSRLLSVCAYFKAFPRPNRYLRQLDVPGIDTKFIEKHKPLLEKLLPLVLPPETVLAETTHFESRFGLLHEPSALRFRLLDPALALEGFTDLSVPLDDFAAWSPDVDEVFLTENKINMVCFPPVPRALVIFGQGYGVDALRRVPWLTGKRIYYWGDIDTHGFSILSRLRAFLPQTRSILMDRETLLRHRDLWGQEAEGEGFQGELAHLTSEEQALFVELRDNLLGEHVRFEQERIPFSDVVSALGGSFHG